MLEKNAVFEYFCSEELIPSDAAAINRIGPRFTGRLPKSFQAAALKPVYREWTSRRRNILGRKRGYASSIRTAE